MQHSMALQNLKNNYFIHYDIHLTEQIGYSLYTNELWLENDKVWCRRSKPCGYWGQRFTGRTNSKYQFQEQVYLGCPRIVKVLHGRCATVKGEEWKRKFEIEKNQQTILEGTVDFWGRRKLEPSEENVSTKWNAVERKLLKGRQGPY